MIKHATPDLPSSELRAEIERLQALLKAKTTPGYELLGSTMEKLSARVDAKDAEIERLLAMHRDMCVVAGNQVARIERLEAVIIRYLDFAKDVGVSPVAPELKPIRDAMRAALAEKERT